MEIVNDGWLIKSPPEKRIWRAKWRRRWFVLKHSGQIPGQYLLEYYTEPSCKKLKGKIDLDQCEQVDAGLSLESRKWNYQFMFDIRTPKRIYFLVAETDTEMNNWVSCICSVCGLKIEPEEEQVSPTETIALNVTQPQLLSLHNESTTTISEEDTNESPDSPSRSYIPMSECFSGKAPVINGKFGSGVTSNVMLDEAPPPPSKHHNERTLSGEFYDYPRPSYVTNMCGAFQNASEEIEKVHFPHSPDHNFESPKEPLPVRAPIVNWETYPKEFDSSSSSSHSSSLALKNVLPVSPQADIRKNKNSDVNSRENRAPEIYENVAIHSSESEFLRKEIPPRPPKPPHLIETPQNYQNIINNKFMKYENVALDTEVLPAMNFRNNINSYDIPPPQPSSGKSLNSLPRSGDSATTLYLDEMYDFPRPVTDDTLNAMPPAPPVSVTHQRKHAYSNAPAGYMSNDNVFTYDVNDIKMYGENYLNMDVQKTTKSSEIYTDMTSSVYSNLPSPGVILSSPHLPPPAVNRDLKPRKGFSEIPVVHSRSCSSASSTDKSAKSPSPFENNIPPAINRELKPKHAVEASEKQNVLSLPSPSVCRIRSTKTKRSFRKTRKTPSVSSSHCKYSDQSSSDDDHSSSGSSRRNSANEEQAPKFPSSTPVHRLESEIHYLDLDLESDVQSPKSPERPTASTVYNTVDFVKTKAFNELRLNFKAYRSSH